MTITIDLPSEAEETLRNVAEAEGKDASTVAAEMLKAALAKNAPAHEETALEKAVATMKKRTPEEVAEARKRVLEASRPARLLPPGKTLEDVVAGEERKRIGERD
jgi:hypothetical protein